MFSLGDKGIPVNVVFQFLAVSLLITALRFMFFTDTFIRKMALWLRSLCLFTGIVIVISAFIIAFRWFPVGMWQYWAMFFACFGLSALGSYLVMNLKKKDENRRMEKALERLKAEEGNVNG